MSFLNIEDPEAFELAKVIAEQTGKSLTRVVIDALKHEKERVVPRRPDMDKIHALLAEVDALPILDARDPQEILDSLYDEHGLRA